MRELEKLTPSMEDYLETILILEEANRVARVKDIAAHMGVQMPSVTGALKTLKSHGLVEYEKNSYINLTPKGMIQAREVFKRHEVLTEFFKTALDLEGKEIVEQSCRIEHIITQETTDRIVNLTRWLQANAKGITPGTVISQK